jgi:bifunctional DNA-binding transcriptional regulator/antitoxin component of YhaV-PrlF toxin-antitoxin module
MPKIQETKQGKFIYLPKEFTQLMNWNKGDTLAIFPDRSAKQTLVMQKTIDASETTTRSPKPRPIQQPQQQARPEPPRIINLEQRPIPTLNTLNPERIRQFIQNQQHQVER